MNANLKLSFGCLLADIDSSLAGSFLQRYHIRSFKRDLSQKLKREASFKHIRNNLMGHQGFLL